MTKSQCGADMCKRDINHGFERTELEQARENLNNALRALELVPQTESELVPHPLVIVRAEIVNAMRNMTDKKEAA